MEVLIDHDVHGYSDFPLIMIRQVIAAGEIHSPDNEPSEEFKPLDHAPSSCHGIYLEGVNEGLEPLEDYQSGGFHPIHLGETLGLSQRYRVIHKLGHGGFGAVWLCRDTQETGYVAVKVMVGESDADPKTFSDLTLTNLDKSVPGADHITIPLNSFSIDGPNGSHQCIVLPVLGPCVSPKLWLKLGNDPGPILRNMAYQAVLFMKWLHTHGFCHGDELLSIIGHPEKAYVRTESGEDLPASSPQYLTLPADISRLGEDFLTDKICIIDFGEAFPISSPPEDLGMPENYLPPEVLLEHEDSVGPASWWDKWEARNYFFDDQGKWLRGRPDAQEWSLEVALNKPVEIVQPKQQKLVTSQEEQALLADLLYGIFRYDPGQRVSIEHALSHEWFKIT
ncbi:uncharacterized protein N7483_012568 [Penicillium malachiteum]|uniref:uncharacterized protein n=1 Tax=Penicillium malachiteum TaxID=1324776 RepID=UPI0025489520|nr:uncharacterized protein N7483_012568 [Penicillium malachiteum]KAJ5715387.1 hypothetical protein N7483_012568 [Penicillium malachiteum]